MTPGSPASTVRGRDSSCRTAPSCSAPSTTRSRRPPRKDRARHSALGLEIEVPAGVFQNCVEITETSPLEPGEESIKVYCPNVGLVIDEELELIAVYEDAEPPETED